MNLSPHFTTAELNASDTALRLGIDNTAPPDVEVNAEIAAAGMEIAREILGSPIIVHSWHRCEELERVLCAKDFAAWCSLHKKDPAIAWPEYFARKQHPTGFAVDWTCPGFGVPQDCAKMLLDDPRFKFDQLIFEGTWLHTSYGQQARQQVLTATFTGGVPKYTAGVA